MHPPPLSLKIPDSENFKSYEKIGIQMLIRMQPPSLRPR